MRCKKQTQVLEPHSQCSPRNSVYVILLIPLTRPSATCVGSRFTVRRHHGGNKNGQFIGAFVLIEPAAAAIIALGRRVNAADWGHSKHNVFGPAVYAEGVFAYGDGTLQTVWACCCYGHESGDAWKFAADEIVAAGFAGLYDGTTMITDRQKGASYFDDTPELKHKRVACAGHIMDNARSAAPVDQKHFHVNLFWAMQRARSPAELAIAATGMNTTFPAVVKYLCSESLPKDSWVWYAQVCTNATAALAILSCDTLQLTFHAVRCDR